MRQKLLTLVLGDIKMEISNPQDRSVCLTRWNSVSYRKPPSTSEEPRINRVLARLRRAMARPPSSGGGSLVVGLEKGSGVKMPSSRSNLRFRVPCNRWVQIIHSAPEIHLLLICRRVFQNSVASFNSHLHFQAFWKATLNLASLPCISHHSC